MKRFFSKSYALILLGGNMLASTVFAAEEKTAGAIGIGREAVAKAPLNTGNVVQMILGLLFVLALIAGMAWLARRMGRFQTAVGGGMKLLGGLSLGQRERVVLVQVGETQLLLGVAPGQVRTLHVLDQPVAVTEMSAKGASAFAEKLNAVLKQKARP